MAANTKSWHKVQSIITAEDINSPGHLLRCDVIVDTIFRLQIVTKTHELFLEEAPEEFHVRAYDDQGNEFTTVQKMVFKWGIENTVKSSGSSLHGDNIKFINFRDSTYDFEDDIRAIENVGKQGRKVLLEGIKTGSSKVTVRIASGSAYAKVETDVNVMVVANLYLVPGAAYIMVGASVSYHAEQIKSNQIHEIELPTHQYHLQSENTDLAMLDRFDQALMRGLALGSTEVTLKDSNLAPEDVIRPIQADLFVVTPVYITISVNPHKNWNVIVGNTYELVVDIFDGKNNKIFPSDNIVMQLEVEAGFFEIEHRTENGTMLVGKPIKVGTAEVSVTLLGVRDESGDLLELSPHLHASGQLEIFDQIKLTPGLSSKFIN